MKVGSRHDDAMRGVKYTVDCHLLEGMATREIKMRYPTVKRVVYRDDDTVGSEILSAISGGGVSVDIWNGELFGEDTALLTFGGSTAMQRDADELVSLGAGEACVHVWWISAPEAIFEFPPVGVRLPSLTLCDPMVFPSPKLGGWEAAVVYALRLGVLLDKGLFDLAYASIDPTAFCARGCRLVQELLAGDREVGYRINFGNTMARVVDRLTNNELTKAEALAVGMQYELQLGAKWGVCNPRRLADLTGAMAYHGLPSGIDASDEDVAQMFVELYGMGNELNLTLPTAIGKCREKTIRVGE